MAAFTPRTPTQQEDLLQTQQLASSFTFAATSLEPVLILSSIAGVLGPPVPVQEKYH